MSLEGFAQPVADVAWACRADDAPSARALDLMSDRTNRWNAEGEPTIYLSGDGGLALIEAGRHPDDLGVSSRLFRVDLRLPRVLDIRRPAVRAALDLPEDPAWILDRGRTHAVATRLRGSGACDALLVPAAGALDQLDRWNAVIFADDRDAVARWLSQPTPAGILVFDET